MKSLILITLVFFFSLVANASSLTGPFDPNSGHWNTIDNGGFENGLAGWSLISNKGVFNSSTQQAFVGNYSAKCTPTSNYNGAGYAIQKTISVTAGQSYVLSGFFQQGNMTDSGLYLDLNDVYFEAHAQVAYVSNPNNDWTFVWATINVPVNVGTVTIRVVNDGHLVNGQYAYADEVAFTPVSQFVAPTFVPEPSALCLYIITIGMLAIRKFRR